MWKFVHPLHRKSHLCSRRKGIARPQSQFPHFMCLWEIYIFPRSVHIFSCSRIGRPSVGIYINHSQTHECGNWDWGPAAPFLGIFVSNFRYFVFAVPLTLTEVSMGVVIGHHKVIMNFFIALICKRLLVPLKSFEMCIRRSIIWLLYKKYLLRHILVRALAKLYKNEDDVEEAPSNCNR